MGRWAGEDAGVEHEDTESIEKGYCDELQPLCDAFWDGLWSFDGCSLDV